MNILISLQPATDGKEMMHWNAVSFAHVAASPQIYRLLKNANLLKPRHIQEPVKYGRLFWDIARQYYGTGKDITQKLDELYLPGSRIITP